MNGDDGERALAGAVPAGPHAEAVRGRALRAEVLALALPALGSGFVDVTFVADSPVYDPDGFNAQLVRQIGFELRTFGGGSTSAASVIVDAIGF